MTSERRLAAREKDLQLAEAAYEDRLTRSLRICAAGSWGLFGSNDGAKATLSGTNASPDPAWAELSERGDEINNVRAGSGLGPFALHERLLEYRSQATDPNAPGEPRLAQQFLEELTRDGATDKSALKAFYKQFTIWLNKRFDEWDPQQLVLDGNPGDEYSPEVGRIIPLLRTAESPEELAPKVREVFAKMFDEKSAGTESDYLPIAREILAEWNERLRRSL